MGYYLALKRREILTLASTWKNLEDIMLSEISQSQKDHDPTYTRNLNSQIYRDRK